MHIHIVETCETHSARLTAPLIALAVGEDRICFIVIENSLATRQVSADSLDHSRDICPGYAVPRQLQHTARTTTISRRWEHSFIHSSVGAHRSGCDAPRLRKKFRITLRTAKEGALFGLISKPTCSCSRGTESSRTQICVPHSVSCERPLACGIGWQFQQRCP